MAVTAASRSDAQSQTDSGTGRPEDTARFYGWRIVAAAFLAQGLATGATVYVYGVFLKPLVAEFAASRMVVGLGLSALYVVQAVLSPFLGRALDRYSIRAILVWGALLLGGGLVLLSAAQALWQVGLVFALVVGVGSAMAGPLSAGTLVANWFVRQRGRALGIAAMGTSLCGFALPPLAAWLVDEAGWRLACVVLGAGVAALLVPVVWVVVVSRPEERGLSPDGLPGGAPGADGSGGVEAPAVDWTARALLRDRDFWAIALGVALVAGALVALLTHLVAFATDLGIDRERASLLLSVAAAFGMLGKLVFGGIVDRIDRRGAFWLMVGVQGLGWLLLLRDPGYAALLVAAAVLGLGSGGSLPISGALVGATFGRMAFGRVMGLMSPVMMVLTVVTPPLVGHLYDRAGNYELAFRMLFAGTLFAAIPIAFLRVPGPAPSGSTSGPG